MPAGVETYDASSTYYILAHPDLHWVMTDKDNMKYVPGALHFTGSNFAFSHGRIMINNFAYVGKIHDDISLNYIGDSGSEEVAVSGFEILVCDSSLTYSSGTCNNRIESGQCITPVDADVNLWSCSGCFRLAIQADGNLVVYTKSGTVVWSSQTLHSVTQACMETNGQFVLKDNNHVVKWSTPWNVENTDTGAVAMIQDDGQFVVVAGGQTKFTTGVTAPCEL